MLAGGVVQHAKPST